jgi:hypothetical protein
MAFSDSGWQMIYRLPRKETISLMGSWYSSKH